MDMEATYTTTANYRILKDLCHTCLRCKLQHLSIASETYIDQEPINKLEAIIKERFIKRQYTVNMFMDTDGAYAKTYNYIILKDLYHVGVRDKSRNSFKGLDSLDIRGTSL